MNKIFKRSILMLAVIMAVSIALVACSGDGPSKSHSSHRCEGVEWVTVKEATCKETGTKEFVCSCGKAVETETLPLKEHTFDDENDASCGVCKYVRSDEYIRISTVDELKNISEDLSKKYVLVNDIDLGGAEWTPIGKSEEEAFSGVFDGNGCVISDFEITSPVEYVGIFGYNKGTVKDIGLEDFTVSISNCAKGSYTGSLVGYNVGEVISCYATGDVSSESGSDFGFAGGLVGYNSEGSIINCYAKGKVISRFHAKTCYAGGLTAYSYIGVVTNGYATGSVIAESEDSSTYAGGLIGLAYSGSITNCYAKGDVSAETSDDFGNNMAGGLIGQSYFGNTTSCYAEGDVSAKFGSTFGSNFAGGLIGQNDGVITNCYAKGDVITEADSNSSDAGGLVGYNYKDIINSYALGSATARSGSDSAHAGGLVAYNVGNITNCYAMGEVVSEFAGEYGNAGGVLGYYFSGTITNCYRDAGQKFTVIKDGTTTNEATNTDGVAKELTEIQTSAFHTDTLGWSADDWTFTEGSYPTLKNVGASK